jgi:hypothetical protein
MSTEEILIASQQYTIYVNFVILFGGIFGHIINILVFTNSKRFRRNPSAFYLTAESIVNCFHLLISLSSRIAVTGYANDLTQKSLAWCKLKNTLIVIFTTLSLTIVCFAAIDQYLSTSYYPYLKQLSTLKLAHRLTYSAIIIWTLHGIPFLILMKIESTDGCNVYNKEFMIYITYGYYLLLIGFVPIMITSIFAILAYSNVRHIVRNQIPIFRRRLAKQLTAMVLARVAFLVSTTLSYVIYRIFTIQNDRNSYDSFQQAIIQLVAAIAYSLFYLNYAVCIMFIICYFI